MRPLHLTLAITAILLGLTWLDVNAGPVVWTAGVHFAQEPLNPVTTSANSVSLQIRERELRKIMLDVERWERKNDKRTHRQWNRIDWYCGYWEQWCDYV